MPPTVHDKTKVVFIPMLVEGGTKKLPLAIIVSPVAAERLVALIIALRTKPLNITWLVEMPLRAIVKVFDAEFVVSFVLNDFV